MMRLARIRALFAALFMVGCGAGLSLYGPEHPSGVDGGGSTTGSDGGARLDAGGGLDVSNPEFPDADGLLDASEAADAAEALDAGEPADASSEPPDASTEPPDAAVVPSDASAVPPDASAVRPDATVLPPDASIRPDAAMPPDAATPPFTCEVNGTATVCADGGCVTVGPCVFGCNVGAKTCLVPSNVPPSSFLATVNNLDLTTATSPVTINSDTGAINAGATVIRAAGQGTDALAHLSYTQVLSGGVNLGILAVQDLIIPNGKTVNVTGTRAFAVVANGTVTINGILDVGALGQTGGPGGFGGGAAGVVGGGACGGSKAAQDGTTTCPNLCAAGGGGGGHAGFGGNGGSVSLNVPPQVTFPETPGGCAFGGPTNIPLVGGSGGAGGTKVTGAGSTAPGVGGGGGGAVQISAKISILVGATGKITAPGDGGGSTISGGGAGGGAGGAILLEAPMVQVAQNGVLAANGGGGGAGDCT